MDMGFEVVVVPVVEVDRAKDLDRTRQVVAAAIGAIGSEQHGWSAGTPLASAPERAG